MEHQEQTDQVSAKSRSATRNTYASGIAIGLFFLLAALNLYVFLILRQGKPIVGTIDGKIDEEYYRRLLSGNKEIEDISEIGDILAEVYYLTHGEDIGLFRFNIYDEDTKPLRVRAFLKIATNFRRLKKNESYSVAGLDWPNGDIYLLKESGPKSFLKLVFHELGHGHPRSRPESILIATKWMIAKMTGNLAEIECPAYANEIDSIVALMYLDPELGYLVFASSRYGQMNYEKPIFNNYQGEYAIARNYSLYRCLEGGRVEKYPGLESLKEKIKEGTAGKPTSEIIEQIHQGVLEMFKQKFGNREDFEEKYSLLQKYFKDGATDSSF